jgi:hypothetical protein
LPLFSEVGRDMSSWPNAAHFVSWLALCPDNDIHTQKRPDPSGQGKSWEEAIECSVRGKKTSSLS